MPSARKISFSLGILVSLSFAACAQTIAANQVFTVTDAAISGVTVVGRGAGKYPPSVDAILGTDRGQWTNDWLPFGIVVTNNTSEDVVAFAARWAITDSEGNATSSIDTRSLWEDSTSKVPQVLAGHHPGFQDAVNFNYQPTELARYRNARSIAVTLDGVVFGSGRFAGPDTANEFSELKAEGVAAYNLATALLAKRDAGVRIGDIVEWLRRTASAQVAGSSLQNRDWLTAITGNRARSFLRFYNAKGESWMYDMAQRQAQQPHLTVYR